MKLVSMNENEYRTFTNLNTSIHFLQSYEWGELSKQRGYTPFYIGLLDKDKFVASALLLQKKLFFGFSYFYIPRGYNIDYKNTKLIKIFTDELKNWCKKKKGIFFKIDPDIKLHTIDSNAAVIEGENNYKLVEFLEKIGFKRRKLNKYFETMQPRFTFRIPLEKSIEEIEGRYSQTNIQRIKKAEKNGIIVEKGTEKDISEFVRLMKMTEKRQGFYSHDENFYQQFYNLFSKNNNVTLYLGKLDLDKTKKELLNKKESLNDELNSLIEINSKKANSRKKEINKEIEGINNNLSFYDKDKSGTIVVSSYLTVNYGNKCWALYAANDMKYKGLFANYLVYKTQIRDAKEMGAEIFDVFGTIGDPNSKSNLIGLHDFKKKWGGEYIEFIGEFDFITNNLMYMIYKILIPIRHKFVRKTLRKKAERQI